MNKLYDRIDFVNNTTPALNQTNLNKMSKAIDDIDDRVIDIAGDVITVVPQILDKYADIEALATNPPYIGQNGHWWTWDTDTNQYVDSGVDAGVSVTVGTTTTLSPGSNATVTNSGTDTDPVLNFGIPQGAAGQNGQDGAPGVGVPSGGTTGQVLKKVSGTDYDTEWANESGGGSSGHTILNSSGTAMPSRSNLQFSGISVKDDSTNDKTVVEIPQFTQAEWNNLSSAQKAAYNGCTVIIKDDYDSLTLITEVTFVKNTDTFTLESASHRYKCEKDLGSVPLLVSSDLLVQETILKYANGNEFSLGRIEHRLADVTATSGGSKYMSFAYAIPQADYNFLYVPTEVHSTRCLSTCYVGEGLYSGFASAKVIYYKKA